MCGYTHPHKVTLFHSLSPRTHLLVGQALRYVFNLRDFSGVMRPYVVFFYSANARRAVVTTWRILPSVSKIVLLELYIVLVYACLCFVLYSQTGSDGDPSFRSLRWSFIHLYELSTTVNNPDIWVHLYLRNPYNGFVFVSFLVILLYFMHNLIIANVYEMYSHSLIRRMHRRNDKRRVALQKAFASLDHQRNGFIEKNVIMMCLRRMRQH